jgi:hypothetical protein
MVLRSPHRRSGPKAFGPRRPHPGAARSEHRRAPKLVDPRLIDHAVGLELQLVDAVEQRTRARVQGAVDEARNIEREIDRLHDELAETAARLAVGS